MVKTHTQSITNNTRTHTQVNDVFVFGCLQVSKHTPRVLPDRVSDPRPSAGDKQPTDADRDACMELYTKAKNLRISGKAMTGTNKLYPCVGIGPICRQYEVEHGLSKNSIKDRTLRGFVNT